LLAGVDVLIGAGGLLLGAGGEERPFGLEVGTYWEKIWRFVGVHVLNGNI